MIPEPIQSLEKNSTPKDQTMLQALGSNSSKSAGPPRETIEDDLRHNVVGHWLQQPGRIQGAPVLPETLSET